MSAGNGIGERGWACIGEDGGQSLQGIGGGTWCLWDDNSLTGGEGGGNFSGYRTSGHAFVGVARHWRTGVRPLVISHEALAIILDGGIEGARRWMVEKVLGEQLAKV